MDRLKEIAKLCNGSNVLLDVGCDHGYVIIDAILNYGVKYAIGTDINQGPLEKARLNIIKNNIEDKTSLILTDGIKDVNLDFDTVVIAGMGGLLIKKILEDSFSKIINKKLIIEANNNRDIVRKYLCNNGFIINNEIALFDNDKYYEIIEFIPGNNKYNEIELKYGPILIKNKPKAFIKYYNDRINFINNILKDIKDINIINEKKNELKIYHEILGEIYE